MSENKATGIVKGTWDMFYYIKPMVWFEAKVGKNDLTKEQKEFMERGETLGHLFFTFYSLEEFKDLMYGFH